MTTAPITSLLQAEEQHMLMLFLPVRSEGLQSAIESVGKVFGTAGPGTDLRPSQGVHFFMLYHMPAGASSPIIVPTFQTAPAFAGKAKDLLLVLSIYDADFEPYIGSFLTDPAIVGKLNTLLAEMDEDGLGIAPDDPASAANILANGGVEKNAEAFFQLLMRYNFADPTVPATGPGGSTNPQPAPRYTLGATFPGLTIAKILDPATGYPAAGSLWPSREGTPPPPAITYEPSTPPAAV